MPDRSCSGRRDQQLLPVGRPKAICPAREVALGERGRRHVPALAEAGVAGQLSISAGVKKLMKGVPLARAPFSAS